MPFTVHVDTVPPLHAWAQRTPDTQHLVVTPVRAHRRNLRNQLREHDCPQTNFEFARILEVARRVSGRDGPTETLDTVDRLYHLRSLLAEARQADAAWFRDLAVATGTRLSERPEDAEAIRSEIELITGFHPDRLAALRSAADGIGTPADQDSHARITAAVAMQRALTQRVDPAPTPDTVIRAATRTLAAEGAAAWQAAYETVDRVTVAGMASLPAALVDFLRVVATEAAVDIHLYLRAATGPTARDRLPALCAVDTPGNEVIES
ncbi:hypothetical protein RYH80_19240 [Halobaculum sp. MBLA0147]|uniref:hypothetical protein n=1 Tax=Halobaculum sp. MBLA0147 TaxID=3079934 RepID=UPI0035259726